MDITPLLGFAAGFLAYGIILREWPIILWNSISLVLAVSILYLKHRFG